MGGGKKRERKKKIPAVYTNKTCARASRIRLTNGRIQVGSKPNKERVRRGGGGVDGKRKREKEKKKKGGGAGAEGGGAKVALWRYNK